MEEVVSTAVSQATPPLSNVPPTIKSTLNLRVAMPSASIPTVSDQTQSNQTPTTSATFSQSSTSYFPMSSSTTSGPPPASPIGTPSTPKLKLSLADYRARRASGMVTPSTSTDPQSVGEGFQFLQRHYHKVPNLLIKNKMNLQLHHNPSLPSSPLLAVVQRTLLYKMLYF